MIEEEQEELGKASRSLDWLLKNTVILRQPNSSFDETFLEGMPDLEINEETISEAIKNIASACTYYDMMTGKG
jgi:hypothetical protein